MSSAVFRSGGATPLFLSTRASAAFRSFRSRTPPLLPSSSIQRRFSQTKPSEDAIRWVNKLVSAGIVTKRDDAEDIVDGFCTLLEFYKSITQRNLEQVRRNLDSDASIIRSKLDSLLDRLAKLESRANGFNEPRIAHGPSIIITAGAAGLGFGAGVVYADSRKQSELTRG